MNKLGYLDKIIILKFESTFLNIASYHLSKQKILYLLLIARFFVKNFF